MSYVQFAMQGLRHQMSQGAANWTVEPGDRFTFYKLVDSVPSAADKDGHEKSFFDGIDTTWPGLAAGLAAEQKASSVAKPELTEIASSLPKQRGTQREIYRASAAPLMKVVSELHRVSSRSQASRERGGKARFAHADR